VTQRLLTIDLGNSRCKLRVWRVADGRRTGREGLAELEGGERLAERLGGWLRAQEPIDAAAFSSVADATLADRVRGVVTSFLRGDLYAEPDTGLEILCDDPAAVGRDRLYAARGALDRADGGRGRAP
jgi:pantothenate kinase type III